MAFARVYSAQTELLSGHIVSVEIDTSRGLNNFTIVGLGDRSVDEARDRVGSALKNAGFESPKTKNQKTVVSLSPAELRKEGAHFDLPIALGFLIAEGMEVGDLDTSLFVGELGLDGTVRPVRGILAIALAAARERFHTIYVPKENAAEAALVTELTVYPVETLRALVEHIEEGRSLEQKILPITARTEDTRMTITETDFGDIVGQESAKRGLLIAAAGGHNVLMYGPPGTGKTMLARALAGILPVLSREDAMEVATIHSIAGSTSLHALNTAPPFRAPHHTSSYTSVIGGGANPKPGEITLAHHGVLFLDEFPEFDRRVLESLRQPLEEQSVSISRAKSSAIFPAQFIFVAAMNPCPCGWKGSKKRACTCTAIDLVRYQRKLSGPLLDRIDIALYVGEIGYDRLASGGGTPESEQIRTVVTEARARAYARARAHGIPEKINSMLRGKELALVAPLTKDASAALSESAERLALSGRAYHRTQKLARTIADLDGAQEITRDHILEAIRYRPQSDSLA
jgi:magnesium chelatase family protein